MCDEPFAVYGMYVQLSGESLRKWTDKMVLWGFATNERTHHKTALTVQHD